jgi:hypothetical protein
MPSSAIVMGAPVLLMVGTAAAGQATFSESSLSTNLQL